MKTKIQIKSIWGKILFEHERENNTIKDTVEDANLSRANLRGADLRGANLRGADLSGADLRGADLSDANLSRANLRGADLRGAYLRGAYLSGADLSGAYLRGADLSGADLSGAYLRGADLSGAYLSGADLSGAENINQQSLWFNQTRILPEGDIIGYKKCKGAVIVKLLIPKEAKRSHSFGRKCRAEFAEVLEIYDETKEAFSSHDNNFKYEVGKTVKPLKPFSENWLEECESGIHFFITKVEAEEY